MSRRNLVLMTPAVLCLLVALAGHGADAMHAVVQDDGDQGGADKVQESDDCDSEPPLLQTPGRGHGTQTNAEATSGAGSAASVTDALPPKVQHLTLVADEAGRDATVFQEHASNADHDAQRPVGLDSSSLLSSQEKLTASGGDSFSETGKEVCCCLKEAGWREPAFYESAGCVKSEHWKHHDRYQFNEKALDGQGLCCRTDSDSCTGMYSGWSYEEKAKTLCHSISCPEHASKDYGTGSCICQDYYEGVLEHDYDTNTVKSGQCSRIPCPHGTVFTEEKFKGYPIGCTCKFGINQHHGYYRAVDSDLKVRHPFNQQKKEYDNDGDPYCLPENMVVIGGTKIPEVPYSKGKNVRILQCPGNIQYTGGAKRFAGTPSFIGAKVGFVAYLQKLSGESFWAIYYSENSWYEITDEEKFMTACKL